MSGKAQCQSNGHPQTEPGQLEFSMAGIGKKILVLSGKGGVGKSTVAVNLAVELARKGNKVGLLDVDLHGPSVPGMMGMGGLRSKDNGGKFIPLETPTGLKVMSVAFLIDDDSQAVIWRGPMKHSVIQQLLAHTDWGTLDYLVIDAPPGTGDEPLGVAQLVGDSAGAVIVTTPQKVAIADVRRCITFCRQLSLPIWGVVENMASMCCPHCQKAIDLYDPDGGKRLAEEAGLDLLGSIPIDTGIAYGGDEGLSISDCTVAPQVHDALEGIVDGLLKQISTKGN